MLDPRARRKVKDISILREKLKESEGNFERPALELSWGKVRVLERIEDGGCRLGTSSPRRFDINLKSQ